MIVRRLVTDKLRGVVQLRAFDNRWPLIVDRLLGRPVSTYEIGGVRIVTDHTAGDAPGVREVFASEMYRTPLAAFDLPSRVRVLDLGAHVGSFTLLLVALGHEIDDATLVELNPTTCERLRTNVEANVGAVARVVNAALNGDGRAVTVALGRGDTGDSIERGSAARGPATATAVAGVTIDELVADASDPIDVCKLDVEGAEYDVFDHPHHEGLRRCRTLIIEIHDRDGDRPAALVGQIEALGFRHVVRPPAPVGVHAFRNVELVGGSGSGGVASV